MDADRPCTGSLFHAGSHRDFKNNLDTDYTKFFYAPFFMAGLLRWRMVEPWTLVAGQDHVADAFVKVIQVTLPDIEDRARVSPNLRKYVIVLKQLLEELQGHGKNPELLLDIFARDQDLG